MKDPFEGLPEAMAAGMKAFQGAFVTLGVALSQVTPHLLAIGAFLRQHPEIWAETPRQQFERELGYPVPDWVWQVEEHLRRTRGSGNGRIMRE